MASKAVLIASVVAQILAAALALRLNRRYPAPAAWLFISGAALVMAVLHMATLYDIWHTATVPQEQLLVWTRSLASLLISILLLAGMALIEPLFRQISQAQRILEREREQLASQVRETEDEMRVARKIQRDLLPRAAPDLPGFDLAGESRSAVWTSGDYFDYVPFPCGDLGLIVADASGHGTGPALLMSSTRGLIRALARTYGDVGELLTQANRAVAADVQDGRFVTAFLARLNPATGEIRYAGAGHAGLLLHADGSRQILEPDSPPLGAASDAVVTVRRLDPLVPGDVLILVTDGLLETQSARGEQFGTQRLLDVADAHRQQSAAGILQAIFSAARKFSDDGPQHDDMTAIVLKVEST
ncbi:MAG: PP2C family protein-serine/threonine phosphatase [Pirellulaceae bacterium]|nr:PP2C family protein-serine/threonine phosphatase [Pirellulaceae bacterium]